MELFLLLSVLLAVVVCEAKATNCVGTHQDDLSNTEIKQAFVIFRHGDRTPDEEELVYSGTPVKKEVFFPFGTKALTNKGKQRAYAVGLYLRKRYGALGLISDLYLPDEVKIRTTPYDRTKMTALTALAALYPPPPAQKWNPRLDWQPIPYDTREIQNDDLMYWYNCETYLKTRDQVYDRPEIVEWLKQYQSLFTLLREKLGPNITDPEDVFFYDNLLQTLNNIGIKPPQWALGVMPQIKDITKLEYGIEFYTPELIKIASGVLLDDILNYTSSYIAGDTEQYKLRLYSAHENNVAGLMAASRTFEPHQPNYGATYSLELRKGCNDDKYYIAAVYAKDAGGPGQVLPIDGCGGGALCEYNRFVDLVKDYAITWEDYHNICGMKR